MNTADTPHPALLLVEDDDVLAELLVVLLDTVADVTWSVSAEAALEEVPRRDWDLIVSDIDLPGMDGIAFVREAKRHLPHVATLMLSGHSDFEHAVAAIRAGADDFLAKPVDRDELLAKVQTLVATSRERKAKGRQVVLAIGAHPDDVEIGVGGILLRHAAAGDDVNVLTVSGGESGGDPGLRGEESTRAAELMGARLFHTDLADTSISVSDGGVTIGTIKGVIDQVGATTIYTHTLEDVHQDHRNVNRATLVAARGIPRVFCYQAPSTTVEFHPTRFVAIDEFMERKLEVIRAYATQTAIRHYLDEDLLRSTARYWSRFTRATYVEPLEVVRDSDAADDPMTAPEEGLDV
jgi:LmbE family N-acetylglucosaminyl deacetylase/CheY-like chemotaxis protein